MEFYSVVLRKKINIPASKIKTVTRKGRKFAVGTYKAKGKTYEAWRVLGKA
jgi:ribosomal protein L13E